MNISLEENEFKDIKKSNGDEFFAAIDNHIKCKIPQYVKNVLVLTGFDNAMVFSKFTSASCQEIEEFMQNVFSDKMLQPNNEIIHFLGIYAKCQKQFKFLPGHKAMLNIIAETCKRICEMSLVTRPKNDDRPSTSTSTSSIPAYATDEDNCLSDDILNRLYNSLRTWICSQKTVRVNEVSQI